MTISSKHWKCPGLVSITNGVLWDITKSLSGCPVIVYLSNRVFESKNFRSKILYFHKKCCQTPQVGFSKGLGSNVYLFKVQYGEYGEYLKTDGAQIFVRPAEYTLE